MSIQGIQTSLDVKTAASAAVLTYDGSTIVQNYFRLDSASTNEKALVDHLLASAQAQIEDYCNITMISTVYYYYLTKMPADKIVLPVWPVSAVASIKYKDGGSDQTWSDDNYWYDTGYTEKPFAIYYDTLASADEDVYNAITVEFTAGYADSDAVPDRLKQAILALALDMYDQRGDVPRERFTSWKALAYPFRIWHAADENE